MIPEISIVIATYNYARYLPEALESVRSQTFANFEAIVVDDGSTDGTEAVIQPYLTDPRITYHRTEHVGQPSAKNEGLRLARGRLVAFLDADDIWMPTKLEKQAALFAQDPDLGVVFCRRRWIDEDGHTLDLPERPVHRGHVLEKVFHQSFICFSSSMIRRAVLDDVGLFDESIPLAIDYDLWLRIAPSYRFDYVDEPLVGYRTGHANLSQRSGERMRCVRRILHKFLVTSGGRDRLPRSLVSMALADLCCDEARTLEPRSYASLQAYFRALSHRITHRRAWQGLATNWWPEAWRARMLRLLGRPDWRQRSYKAEVVLPVTESPVADRRRPYDLPAAR